LIVYPSNGAVDNVRALVDRPGVQLGIVQSDVLTAMTDQQRNLAVRAAAEGMRLLFPLYDEQVHIVARTGIKDLDGLRGRLVAIGRESSGTYLTALALFQLAAVVPAAMITMDEVQALAHLRAGRIDAMVSVVGHPMRLLREGVRLQDNLALLPVTAPAILDAYAATEIRAGTYPWQPNAVATVAVTALLIVHDADGRHCAMIGRLAQRVVEGLGWLLENGHPYWKRVDLERPVTGWQRYDCGGSTPAERPAPRSSAMQ